MNNSTKKIKSFTDLNVWKEAHRLVLIIYRITKDFPKEEMFGLTSQIRRAAVSITSNIAEGFSKQTYKEKTYFYFIARGSLTEIQSQLLVARDLSYISKQDFDNIANQTVVVHKLLNGLIKKSKDIQNSSNKGFTLVEMIIAISILTIMTFAIVMFFITLYKEQATDVVRIKRIREASVAIEKISSEVRKMNRGEDGSYSIGLAEEQLLVFYSDIDNDGLTEKIEYFLSGTDLMKRTIEPTGDPYQYILEDPPSPPDVVMASNVKNGADPIFRYYDEDYTGSEGSLSDPVNVTAVRIIEVNLEINPDNNYLSQPFLIETKIHPRNLKSFN